MGGLGPGPPAPSLNPALILSAEYFAPSELRRDYAFQAFKVIQGHQSNQQEFDGRTSRRGITWPAVLRVMSQVNGR